MRHRRFALAVVLIALAGFAGCGALTKGDGKALTPLEGAKVTQKALSDSWTAIQEAFAGARLTAEAAEQKGQALAAGQITAAQWARFTELDKKVIASGRELAVVTAAWEAGTKDEQRIQAVTAELLSLFSQTSALATAFGLKIPGLPEPASKSSALPLLLAGLPLVAGVRRRSPSDVRPIAGGAGPSPLPSIVAQIAAGLVGAAAPTVAKLVTSNPEDQAKAEAAASLFTAFINGVAGKLPGILEGIQDPASIKLSELWGEDATQVLERMRRERAGG